MRGDLRLAIRSLGKSPAFSAVALTVLALGIGAGSAVFSVVDAVVLRGLPFDEHDRIVAVLERDTRRPITFGGGTTTPQMYLDWRRLQRPFESVAAVRSALFWIENARGEPDVAVAQRITHEFFTALRTPPMRGRPFTPADEVEGQHRVAILGYGFWQRQFGGDDVVGKTIALRPPGGASEERWEIVGVMPADFSYPVAAQRPTDLFVPQSWRTEDRVRATSRDYGVLAIARLKDGETVTSAGAEMNQLMAALDAEYPEWGPGRRASVVTLHEHIVGRVRSWMLILLGAVSLVLFIACANVANLILARSVIRGRETAIRIALGGSRWQSTRGCLVEGLVLALTGSMLGVLLALALVRIATAWLPEDLPRVAAIAVDLRVFVAAVGAALLAGTIFGVLPALHSSRPNLAAAMTDGGRSSTIGTSTGRLRHALVVGEVALAVVLLVGAGLFIASFARVTGVDIGFDYRNVLVVNARAFPPGTTATPGQQLAGLERILAAVTRIEGVEIAGAVAGGLPLTGNWSRTRVALPGRGELASDEDTIDRRTVTTDYLRALQLPLVRGRWFSDGDREGRGMVVIVNEAAERRYWPGEGALGRRITIDGVERTVVGIVGNIRHLGPELPSRQEAYIPARQDRRDPKFPGAGNIPGTLVVRTSQDALSLVPAVKASVWSVNAQQRFDAETVTLEGYLDRLVAPRRFNMALLALFGILGLVIAAAGVYGVVSYLVVQRTSEIGIRMAVGGTPRHIVRLVMRQASMLIGAGLAAGALGSWYLSMLAKSLLFDIEPRDVRVLAAALATLTCAGLLASAIPARRAASVDPLVALRSE